MSLLERARRCYEARAWQQAFALFEEADTEQPLPNEDVWLWNWAAGLSGHDAEQIALLERVERTHEARGEREPAARAAFWLGFRLASSNQAGKAAGWLSTAERLLSGERDSATHGYLQLVTIRKHMRSGDYAAAASVANETAQTGERFSEPDLVGLARNLEGRARLRSGEVERGLSLLDEVMLAAVGGRLSAPVTGVVLCSAIEGCQEVYALERAREWTSDLSEWCSAQGELVAFTGACWVHHAEILCLAGDWPQALEQARRAEQRFAAKLPPVAADALYQTAEVQRQRGALADAERAYRAASESGRDPQPGLSLLRLAQGDREAALGAIQRAVNTAPTPLVRLKFLPALVEIALSASDVELARRASGWLAEAELETHSQMIAAHAAQARGAIELAEQNPAAALPSLRSALELWQQLQAPYNAAKVRLLLSRACFELGDSDGANLEREAAERTFERLGASADAKSCHPPNPEVPPSNPSGLSPRELEVLRLVATGKTNRAIAEALALSEKTVARHLSNIFTKLDLPSRAAATAYAYEHHLIE